MNQQPLEDLLIALAAIDQLLEQAVLTAQVVYGIEGAGSAYRGLHISQDEVDRLLARETGVPILYSGEADGISSALKSPLLAWVQQMFGLSPFEMQVLLLSLAPEIDLRYERLYAYLQDDVTRKRPTVDLALNLLCASRDEKMTGLVCFAPDAPLFQYRVMHLVTDSPQNKPSLLAHFLKVDEQIVRLLLRQTVRDSRIAPFCEQINPTTESDDRPLYPEIEQRLQQILRQARNQQNPVQIYTRAVDDATLQGMLRRLAQEIGVPILKVDLAAILTAGVDCESILQVLFREAWLQDIILCLEGWDALKTEENALLRQQFLTAFAKNRGLVLLVGHQAWTESAFPPLPLVTLAFPPLGIVQRQLVWQTCLEQAGIQAETADVQRLGDRFQLSHTQIAAAVAMVGDRTNLESSQSTVEDLFAIARSLSSKDLARVAQKVESSYTWADIVLPEDALLQLQEICQRVTYRQRVFEHWGFEAKLSHGRGVTALFTGPSGTGKTMAASIIAHALGLDLYRIDLSSVVSKYIGETEKNLDRIFQSATTASAILLFDEADALFGKRSEVRDSHDRYANLEISYLLQKMEEYEGIALLATNLRQNLDEAFVRRLAFTIYFPFPEEADRRRIWECIFPAQVPLSEDVDFDFLANQFMLSGGNIKNVALAAAFLAAEEGKVTMVHLLRAIRREYQKMGKVLSDEDLRLDQFL